MFLRLYHPKPELRHFVSRIMLNSFELDPSGERPVIPFPPQPEHCLYFYPRHRIHCYNHANGRSSESPHSMLVGPQLSRVDLTMGYSMLVIMVRFQPGGLHRLLRIPMHEIVDEPVDATQLLGREMEHITEQLNGRLEPDDMVELVQQFLLTRVRALKPMLPLEAVMIRMMAQKTLLNVDQLAQEACVSIRQLERQFRERTGMPPKVFARLVRFSHAWVMRERRPDLSWLSIAHACDYADQMHMIRDFRDFAGVTPRILQTDLEKSFLRLQASSFD